MSRLWRTDEWTVEISAVFCLSRIRNMCHQEIIMPFQGSINCGIPASGMGGSGDRERKWEEEFYWQGLKIGVFALNQSNKDHKGLNKCFCTKNTCFWGKFVCEAKHRLLEEITLNEVSLGGSTIVNFVPNVHWRNKNHKIWRQARREELIYQKWPQSPLETVNCDTVAVSIFV